jgi:hypothetical protein
MAVQWGAYEVASGTGMRSGIQIESQSAVVNGSATFVVTFSCWVQPGPNQSGSSGSAFNDNQTFDLSVNLGGLNDSSIAWLNTSNSLTPQQAGPQIITLTYTYGGSSYGTSPGTITISGQVNGVFNGITPNCAVNVPIPARPWANPAATTDATASRVSDGQASVSWDNNDSTSAAYGNIKLYRKTGSGSYALRATLGVVESYSDTGIGANEKYRWRPNVLGANGVEITGDESGDVWTTPAAPSGLVATKLGNGNIRLDWANNVNYSEYSVRIEHSTNGGAFSELTSVSGGVTTYEHTSPSTSVTHTYRIRARSTTGSLDSAYSASSNTVVLLATANAPTNLVPSGVARDAEEDIVLSWQHNPADGTPQSAYQLQYKVDAGGYTTVGPTSSGVSSYTLPAATLDNGHTITWRVATSGENGTLSAYSAESTFTTSARPTAAISTPTASYSSSTLTAEWSYFQEQGSGQATWQAFLYDASSSLLEQISGTTETEATFAATLADAATYTVAVAVTSAAGLTCAPPDSVTFSVTYLPPAAVTIAAGYDTGSGAMVLTVTGEDPEEGVTAAIDTVTIQRAINGGGWLTIVVGLVLAGDPLTAIVLDTAPTINGLNTYRAVAYSALPSSAMSDEEEAATSEGNWAFLSAGPGFASVVKFRALPSFKGAAGRDKALHHFAGREKPVELAGEATSLAVSVSGELRGGSSSAEEFEAMGRIRGVVLWREPTGRRVYGSLSSVQTVRESYRSASVSFSLAEVDYTEGVA